MKSRTDGVHCRESADTGPAALKVVAVTGAAMLFQVSPWTSFYASLFPHPLLYATAAVDNYLLRTYAKRHSIFPVQLTTSGRDRHTRRFTSNLPNVLDHEQSLFVRVFCMYISYSTVYYILYLVYIYTRYSTIHFMFARKGTSYIYSL